MDSKRKKSGPPRLFSQWRTKALFIVFLLVSAVILNRLYSLQIIQGDYYSALARGKDVKIEDVPPRGNIYFQDKAGEGRFLAATNKEVPLVYANPKNIDDEEHVLNTLAGIIDIEQEKDTILARLLDKTRSYALIKRNLSEHEAGIITELELEGVYVKYESVRIYPAEAVGSHVLGFLGFSGDKRIGQYGAEEFHENTLSGNSSGTFSLEGLFSNSIFNDSPSDVELSIDYGIQFVVEKKLAETVERLGAASGTAIFMDPKTGAIISMANFPEFNPNTYNEVEDISIFDNPAVQGTYEPGSAFKPITVAAGLDAGVITPQTTYDDTGKVHIGGYTIENFDKKSRGQQTMTQALENSLNTGMVFIQQSLGKKKFREYVEAFQMDNYTGIDLPGEDKGSMANIKNTNIDINYATASFGQGLSLTPLRLLTAISAIANNGVMMKPYITEKIKKGPLEIVTKPEEIARPISSVTASKVTAMMVSTVKNGYDKKVSVPGYTLAGKTGTAQVPNEDGSGYSDKTIHTFVGFAPAYDPKFVGIIRMDGVKGINFASDSIAPLFGDIASFVLQYYQIPPQ
ncbi:MAG: hypothetical protein A2919_01385 [Candidatus Spechtbacteria bacterium RIFCSPLOWO2_01_FULL_43_12]|uniref:Penicillin-binding protein transpeptidase domain-containing protein n=1 Tax=Candidatus Spechtbacteria bacterium RIFCSPLOWO2_01_FULL_43_12 TaxID=1802162 RepID=A0A1G2HEB5_9BACT|nr:MAG: hypothetical protein A2919_01385 [Candidatus Spechtbacteria bacterium RIFCSPLOWO2_01_FULL_43_12]